MDAVDNSESEKFKGLFICTLQLIHGTPQKHYTVHVYLVATHASNIRASLKKQQDISTNNVFKNPRAAVIPCISNWNTSKQYSIMH
ncbi:hypothetical protein BaRGS_00032158 [Batillaria attramentaria]|uniref:Uncharacterized protein n=1 Tax=Batillaria attramentaria TaxID=370345 RepID=A0ABD0JQ48_9CAEN